MRTHFDPRALADPDTAESAGIVRTCVHCGFCNATCPTYLLLGDELDGPRGRIYLIKDMLEHARPATAPVVRHLDRCLSCLACMTTCPSGVHYQHLIDHARVHVERTYRRPWRERLLRACLAAVLPYPRRLRVALALASVTGRLARLLPRRRALARWVPASVAALFALAASAQTQREARVPAERPRHGTAPPRGRVAVLAGCAQQVLTPRAHAACVRLIERAGFEAVVIEGCCGALVHHLGRAQDNRALAGGLMERLEAERRGAGLDAVIATASGCGTHLKDYGHLFRHDARWSTKAAATSAATRDITEWLHEAAQAGRAPSPRPPGSSPSPGLPPPGMAVAYHSACSMQHGQKLDRIPRLLLEQAGFRVEEIPDGHLCCGSAGTYNILQPAIAAQLRDAKLENIRRTSSRLVATGNVGCIMQLASAADLDLVHTAELLDWAQGGPAPIMRRARSESRRDRP